MARGVTARKSGHPWDSQRGHQLGRPTGRAAHEPSSQSQSDGGPFPSRAVLFLIKSCRPSREVLLAELCSRGQRSEYLHDDDHRGPCPFGRQRRQPRGHPSKADRTTPATGKQLKCLSQNASSTENNVMKTKHLLSFVTVLCASLAAHAADSPPKEGAPAQAESTAKKDAANVPAQGDSANARPPPRTGATALMSCE